jgi:D-psicose/D-tagatose/L-ribulose 3-epimerase
VKLAISNIAWDASEDDAIAEVLRREGADGIEIAPTKWRAEPLDATAADIAEFRRSWEDRGLPIVAMQSLLFGKPELQLFGDAKARGAMLGYLRRMLDFASAVGATAVVFGSPKNRSPGVLDSGSANALAVDFLRTLAPHADAAGVAFCVEPVPSRYACDFIQTPAEALELVQRVNQPGIYVNADLGAIIDAGADPQAVLAASRARIGHYHASEIDFVPLADAAIHERAATALREIGYDRWVSVEMKAVGGGGNVDAVTRAIRLARACY